MQLNKLAKRFIEWIKPGRWSGRSPVVATRGNLVHVIILDGTMSSLDPGCETNAGLAYRRVSHMGAPVSVYYEAGVQWSEWRQAPDVLIGRGINRQIRRAYGYLCSRYRPGDKIFLLGYSRGAYAVRSLGGVIDQVGLLKPEHATERNIQTAYRHYQCTPGSEASAAFTSAYCHDAVEIEMIGVWDTAHAFKLSHFGEASGHGVGSSPPQLRTPFSSHAHGRLALTPPRIGRPVGHTPQTGTSWLHTTTSCMSRGTCDLCLT